MSEKFDRPRVGVSQCLLGDLVRYDGDAQRDNFVADTLAQHWQLLPLCPELAIGMSVPRPPIQIVQIADALHARGVAPPHQDVTEALRSLVTEQRDFLESLSGFLLMTRSPSCGRGTVKLHDAQGQFIDRSASGIFCTALMQALPWLPVIEAIDFEDASRRENFFTQVAALADFKLTVEEGGASAKKLIAFYSRYKYLVMAQGGRGYKTLGPMLAKIDSPEAVTREFKTQLMIALRLTPTRNSHVNTLQHLQGYFRGVLDVSRYQALGAAIEAFAHDEIALHTVISEFKAALACCDLPYLAAQTYWQPYPHAWQSDGF